MNIIISPECRMLRRHMTTFPDEGARSLGCCVSRYPSFSVSPVALHTSSHLTNICRTPLVPPPFGNEECWQVCGIALKPASKALAKSTLFAPMRFASRQSAGLAGVLDPASEPNKGWSEGRVRGL